MNNLINEVNLEHITDWAQLWADLVTIHEERRLQKYQSDTWYGRADHFRERVRKRWQNGSDSSREFVIQTLKDFPHAAVLDIGAGTGDWSLLMAEHGATVTALDPSESMLEILTERVAQSGLKTINAVKEIWPNPDLGSFDICFCSHAMYGADDLPGFISAMQKAAAKRIIMLIRAPHPNAVMAQAARLVLGHPYDSPNFQVAYNVLLSMGIFPNVIMEDRGWWKPWICENLPAALLEIKQRLGLLNETQYDAALTALLRDNLKHTEQGVEWPRGVRTALMYWDVENEIFD
jgi:2-polyprenyl-3-methyl-5-hydroxy-6-metoxy-1,4-benzoquinol methylase